ncbi:INSYN2B protein-like isoform X1 [Stegostoma tigrinum]|uniref:INSYN2B protein-like isoform X1 n=1 Tax=Stegostoma tigrinum TaxID=3053191 RepID=UPI00202B40FC|nr:INSYN2B protein-like isoform X1 [Stegostoma tigrinum]
MVSKETNRSLVSSVHFNSDRTMTVRSVLLKRDPAGSSESERRQHRRRQKTQQVRFKDLADGPDEAGGRKTPETSAEGLEVDRQAELTANSQRNWQQARPCSLTLPNPRKACTSTAIQTSPSLQKQFGAFRFRSKSVGDFGEPGEQKDGLALPSAPLPGAGGETTVADAREEVEEEEEQGEPEGIDRATAINGRGAEKAGEPLSNCADPNPALSSQQSERTSEGAHGQSPNGLTVSPRIKDKAMLCKDTPDILTEQDHKTLTAGQHCAAKSDVAVRSQSPSIQSCSLNSKASPPTSKETPTNQFLLRPEACSKLKAPTSDLDSNHSESRKVEFYNMSHPLLKDQPCVYRKSCLKSPASITSPRQPNISHRTEQLEPCPLTPNPSGLSPVQGEASQLPSKTFAQCGEPAVQSSQSGPLLSRPDDSLELVPSRKNPQDDLPSAAGKQRAKSGCSTQHEITSLQSRLQTMEDVLQTSQQTIKVLLDVIQDLEKKEAVRDGRQSYRTGQDIANCGTCRDCACIIYSVEHDFRQQEFRFHRVLSSMETDTGQSSEQPGTPNKQEESPIPRQPARTESKKSKRKCFWFL